MRGGGERNRNVERAAGHSCGGQNHGHRAAGCRAGCCRDGGGFDLRGAGRERRASGGVAISQVDCELVAKSREDGAE